MAKDNKSSYYKDQGSDNKQISNSNISGFDLEERMAVFGESIILFCRSLSFDHISKPIIDQLVRSATSKGANYSEANNESSKKDFRNKICILKKETQETKHWLRMLKSCYRARVFKIKQFWQEAHELTMILQSIINKMGKKANI